MLTPRAKRLRTDSTDAERLVWSRLRAHRLRGWKFKRQQPIGRYVVDFACFDAKLVIELDGGQHADAADMDATRDAWLNSQGLRVLRFWNNDVLSNLDGVLTTIAAHLPPSPQPSPTRGEGASNQAADIPFGRS
jgi:very-short-patch-repair endonuclease